MKIRTKKLRLYPLDTIDANDDENSQRTNSLPLILSQVQLNSSVIVLNPNLDEVQQLMHQLINYVLNIFHGVRKWGEVRQIRPDEIHSYPSHDFSDILPSNTTSMIDSNRRNTIAPKTYYNTIANNKELVKLYQNIGHFFIENRQR